MGRVQEKPVFDRLSAGMAKERVPTPVEAK
jgi:hypothetical protein